MADIRCNCCNEEGTFFRPMSMYQCTNPTCNTFRWVFCADCLKRQKAPKKGIVFTNWCCPYCNMELKDKR